MVLLELGAAGVGGVAVGYVLGRQEGCHGRKQLLDLSLPIGFGGGRRSSCSSGPKPTRGLSSPAVEQIFNFGDPSATPYERQVTPNGSGFEPVVRGSDESRMLTGGKALELDEAQVYGLGGYSQYNRVLLCMVGLPARGKSYIVKMLLRYLVWTGFPVKAFNAGNLRRQAGNAGADADFFSNENKEASAMRERIASQCMEECIQWLEEQKGVCVAIFDATNTTRKRRSKIIERTQQSVGIIPVFVESICDNPDILRENYRLKLGNDDYGGMDPEKARADFLERVRRYEERYETVEDDESGGAISYIKLYNVGQKVVMHHITGYLTSQLASYLSNVHISPRSIWLTRHAESEDQLKGVLGSVKDELTPRGHQYCSFLGETLRSCKRQMIKAGETTDKEVLVLMGTAPVHSATFNSMSSSMPENPEDSVEFQAMSTSLLNELDGGVCNGLTYEQIQREHPEIWAAREQDKLHYRYPGAGGESYADVIGRLRPIIIELERQRRSVLVISHLAVQRCLYAYFTGCAPQDMPYLELPMHCVVELRPGPMGSAVRQVAFDTSG